jgi:single-stranded DNA-binding protein
MGRKDVNTITVTGQVEAEPEMRFTADGIPHTTFSLVCAQPTPRDPHAIERFRLMAWDEPLAEQCNDLLPGARVLVEGRLQSTTSDDPEDRARCPFEVIVRDLVVQRQQASEDPRHLLRHDPAAKAWGLVPG